MTPHRTAPPLAAWFVAGLATAATGLALLYSLPAVRQPKAVSMNLERLTHPVAGPRVVALGSSKIMYALSFDSTLAAQIEMIPPVAVTRITWVGARTGDMLEALELLQRAPPSVLLLEAELLLSDHRGPQGTALAAERMRFTLLRWLPRPSPEETGDRTNSRDNHGEEQFAPPAECRWLQNAQHQREYAERGVDRRVMGPSETASYFESFRRLERAGTKIVLLDVPRAPWAESLLPTAFRSAYQARSQWLEAHSGIERWIAPAKLISDEDFCDAGHFTEAGRIKFDHWVAARLTNYLGKPHE